MSTQIIIALCEGPHDVAFLNKIIKTKGFTSNDKSKLDEYPKPLNGILINEASKTDVEGLNIQEVRQSLLPAYTLIKENVHILLYVMGGDGKVAKRKDFLEKIKATIVLPGEIKQGRETHDVTFGIIYFFDADDNGINNRINAIKAELKQVVNSIPNTDFSTNSSFGKYEGMKLGCYIFSGYDNNTGKLEDILLPVMTEDNAEIFENANKFLDDNHDESRLFPLKLRSDATGVTETRSNRAKDKYAYDRTKSVIGTVGQLQQSGGANTVCIGFTDYLTLNKIERNPKCQEILNFLNDFISQ
ncbi:hypothetical protein CMU93_01580 [Elizabethkingia anophelis]|nr:hypothetical protein [Elizabethkingia anophelis]